MLVQKFENPVTQQRYIDLLNELKSFQAQQRKPSDFNGSVSEWLNYGKLCCIEKGKILVQIESL